MSRRHEWGPGDAPDGDPRDDPQAALDEIRRAHRRGVRMQVRSGESVGEAVARTEPTRHAARKRAESTEPRRETVLALARQRRPRLTNARIAAEVGLDERSVEKILRAAGVRRRD